MTDDTRRCRPAGGASPPGRRRSPWRTTLPLAAAALSFAALAAGPALGAESFLRPLGEVAERQRSHFLVATLLILLPILPVLIFTPLVLWRYRRRHASKAAYTPQWEFNPWLEAAMWGAPVVIVGLLSAALIVASTRLDPYTPVGPDPMRVDVVGLDWKWLFIYPDEGVASVGEFVLPVGRAVSLRLTTDTVMQSFFIPALAGQIYAMPGMRTELNFSADAPGETRGLNAQYNVDGFPHQRFAVRALDADDFAAWVESAKTSGPAFGEDTYATLAERGTVADLRTALGLPGTGPVNFALEASGIFECVLHRYHGGAAVPPAVQPGSPDFRAAIPMTGSTVCAVGDAPAPAGARADGAAPAQAATGAPTPSTSSHAGHHDG